MQDAGNGAEATSMSDLDLDPEGGGVQGRLAIIERRLMEQDEEICILKSALSHALNRIHALEQDRPALSVTLPSRPSYKSSSSSKPPLSPSHNSSSSSRNTGSKSAASPTAGDPVTSAVNTSRLTDTYSPDPFSSSPHPFSSSPHLSTSSPTSPDPTLTYPRQSTPTSSSRGRLTSDSTLTLPYQRVTLPVTNVTKSSNRLSSNSSLTGTTGLSPVAAAAMSTSTKRWSSVTPDANDGSIPTRGLSSSLSCLRDNKSPSTTTRQSARYREPAFDGDEGCLRFYLHGHALNLYAPSSARAQDYQLGTSVAAPTQKLKLEWVYGYRGKDGRCNLYLLPTGEIVYFTAAVVVLYNVDEQLQRHYLAHTDDVKCLAVHPDKITIATGQAAGHERKDTKRRQSAGSEAVDQHEYRPHVRVWDSVSLTTLHVIGTGDFDRAVSSLAFSKTDGGQYLVAVDEAAEHVITLWEWQKGAKIAEAKSSLDVVLGAEFHPLEKHTIVTFGRSHITFWSTEGGVFTRKAGVFEKHEKPKYITCVASAGNGDTLTGDASGHLYVWGRGTNRIVQSVTNIHEGGILSLCVMKDGTLLTGGRDRRIVQWTPAYKKTGHECQLAEQFGSIRMLSQGRGNMVLVGTTRNFILQGSVEFQFAVIMQGHQDEVWGLASHPSQHHFVTASNDGRVNIWDGVAHSVMWGFDLPVGAICAAYSPDDNLVTVGGAGGQLVVIDTKCRDVIMQRAEGTEAIACISYSPNGSYLAIGSHDNAIYMYTVDLAERKFLRAGKCQGHSSAVLHLDWSADSQYIRSNSADYELLFWRASSCLQVKIPSSVKDVEWASQTCTISFDVCGIWPDSADGTDVNTVACSSSRNLVATGDDSGRVTLFRFPCNQPKCQGSSYAGHSSHVMSVTFTQDDRRVLSVGGKDATIMQWQVIG